MRGGQLVLNGAKPPKYNIKKRVRCAITDLLKDDSITILPADEGNVTEIMDQTEYIGRRS